MEALGNRMKRYENAQAQYLCPLLPAFARLDGRAFHRFTRGLERPFDKRFTELMVCTTQQLVAHTGARLGYTQSDEITLLWYHSDYNSQIFFNGRVSKMTSVLASLATVFFNRHLTTYLPGKGLEMPVFDCRVWTVPTRTEATNVLLWRERDAVRNSISMCAQTYFKPAETLHKNSTELKKMLWEKKDILWESYPECFRRGTYIQRFTKKHHYTPAEIATLPPRHTAHQHPEQPVQRVCIESRSLPLLSTIGNLVGVFFEDKTPCLNI